MNLKLISLTTHCFDNKGQKNIKNKQKREVKYSDQ